ncbi:MAG: AMP-binding protein [Pseudonocardiaceae bacterium]
MVSSPAPSTPLAANIADLVTAAARRGPDHPALCDRALGDRAVTWGGVDAAVHAEAARLREAGLAPGDRVVVRLPTSAEFCVAVFAVARAGGVVVPVGTAATERELRTLCAHSGAGLLVVTGEDGAARRAAASFPAGGPALLGPPDLGPPDPDPPSAGAPAPDPGTGGEDVAVLAYTSGTSGAPRGVMLSHRALLANVVQCAALRPAPVTGGDRVLLALPLFHSYGLGPGLLQVTHAAATAVLVDRFEPESALEAVQEHRVSTVVGVPPMYRAWLTLPADRLADGLATVRMFLSGAGPLDPAVLAGMRAVTGLGIFEGYGLTETGPVLTSTLVGGAAKPGSVGRPLPGVPSRGMAGVEIRLVDNDGRALPTAGDLLGDDDVEDDDEDAGGTGVIAARGPNLFSGYWPDGAYGPVDLPGLGPGWLRTGDVGFVDADGDLHLVDRADDLIIVNGFNVYPHEVEKVLEEHPGVAEAAVVGIFDERTGEAVRAVVVADGARPDPRSIIEHCAARLARFKVPVEVAFVGSLPHSPTGKLARRLLRGGTGELSPAWPSGAPMPAARGDDDTAADLF